MNLGLDLIEERGRVTVPDFLLSGGGITSCLEALTYALNISLCFADKISLPWTLYISAFTHLLLGWFLPLMNLVALCRFSYLQDPAFTVLLVS